MLGKEEQWDGLDLKDLQVFLGGLATQQTKPTQLIHSLVIGNQLDLLDLNSQEKIYQQYVMYKTKTSISSFNNLWFTQLVFIYNHT